MGVQRNYHITILCVIVCVFCAFWPSSWASCLFLCGVLHTPVGKLDSRLNVQIQQNTLFYSVSRSKYLCEFRTLTNLACVLKHISLRSFRHFRSEQGTYGWHSPTSLSSWFFFLSSLFILLLFNVSSTFISTTQFFFAFLISSLVVSLAPFLLLLLLPHRVGHL